MGDEVYKLHKKLEGGDDIVFGIILMIIVLGLSLGVPLYSFEPKSSGSLYIVVSPGGIIIWFMAFISLLIAAFKFQADVNDFVRAYKGDYPEKSEIEILERAYSDALSHTHESFKNALTAWLMFGAWVSLVEIGLASGNLGVKNSSAFWLGVGLASVLSFVGFVLTILSYLRKRSIEKALFAIQLKKSDKAEISIKI